MIKVPLLFGRSHEPTGLFAMIDDEDASIMGRHHWRLLRAGKTNAPSNLYAANGRGELMHRLITSCPKGLEVDHINRDGLDNQRSNLRIATHSQNLTNQPSRRVWSKRPTTSRYKGVSLYSHPRLKPWRATISVNRKQKSLGYYFTEIDAAKAYDAAAKTYFEGFALLNFPE